MHDFSQHVVKHLGMIIIHVLYTRDAYKLIFLQTESLPFKIFPSTFAGDSR